MKILITAFDAFGQSEVNSSELVLSQLPTKIKDINLTKLLLPTIRTKSLDMIENLLDKETFDVVLCLGMASQRKAISIERVAINVDDFRIPDNEGNQPIDEVIVENGPAAYFSTLPIRQIIQKLESLKIPVELSNSAGTFVCNHVMYGVLHIIETNKLNTKAGFVHLPSLGDYTESIIQVILEVSK